LPLGSEAIDEGTESNSLHNSENFDFAANGHDSVGATRVGMSRERWASSPSEACLGAEHQSLRRRP
jgi:hypothetical protein